MLKRNIFVFISAITLIFLLININIFSNSIALSELKDGSNSIAPNYNYHATGYNPQQQINYSNIQFLEFDFFERFGGGIGVTRMIKAMEKSNLL